MPKILAVSARVWRGSICITTPPVLCPLGRFDQLDKLGIERAVLAFSASRDPFLKRDRQSEKRCGISTAVFIGTSIAVKPSRRYPSYSYWIYYQYDIFWIISKMSDDAPKRDGKQLLLRFKEGSDLRERLTAVAKQNNRSVSAEIIHRLETSISGAGSPPDPDRNDVESRLEKLELRVRALEQAKKTAAK